MYCVSKHESLAKPLISVGVSGDSRVLSFSWVSELGRQLPGSLANQWERDKCVWERAVCLEEYPIGLMVATGDFCLVVPLCLPEGSAGFDDDGIM